MKEDILALCPILGESIQSFTIKKDFHGISFISLWRLSVFPFISKSFQPYFLKNVYNCCFNVSVRWSLYQYHFGSHITNFSQMAISCILWRFHRFTQGVRQSGACLPHFTLNWSSSWLCLTPNMCSLSESCLFSQKETCPWARGYEKLQVNSLINTWFLLAPRFGKT